MRYLKQINQRNYKIVSYALSQFDHYFLQTGLYKSAIYTYSFGKPVFRPPRLFVFSICSVFWIWCHIHRLNNIFVMIVCIDARCSIILFLRWFLKISKKHINILLISKKKTCLQEVLSFLEIIMYKGVLKTQSKTKISR